MPNLATLPEMEQLLSKVLSFNWKVVTLGCIKGGEGKSTTLLNLSRIFASFGIRVLIIDIDPQHNATRNIYPEYRKDLDKSIVTALTMPSHFQRCIAREIEPNISVIPGSLDITDLGTMTPNKLKMILEVQRTEQPGQFNLVLIDTPGRWDMQVEAGYAAADYILTPASIDDSFALDTVGYLMEKFISHQPQCIPKWHVCLNFVRKEEKSNIGRKLYYLKGFPVLQEEIPFSTRIQEAREQRRTLDSKKMFEGIYEPHLELAKSILTELGVSNG